jgi:polyribonucleotide nucleotidyltransferase
MGHPGDDRRLGRAGLSGIPFKGPIGAAKVGYANGQYILNPTTTQLKTSELDLVVAGTKERGADGRVRGQAAVRRSDARRRHVRPRRRCRSVINAINELVAEAGQPDWDWTAAARNEASWPR